MPSASPEYGRPSGAAAVEPVLADLGGADVSGWRAEGASTPWCTIRAASVVGVRHRLAGCTSDDFFAWGHRGDPDAGHLLVAVADGVGSVPGSGDAAARACRAAVAAGLPAGAARAVEGAAGAVEGAAGAVEGSAGAVEGSADVVGAAGEAAGGAEDDAAGRGVASDVDAAVEAAMDAADEAAGGGGATTLVLASVRATTSGGAAATVVRVGDSSAFVVAPDGSSRELFAPPGDDGLVDLVTPALPGGWPSQAERVEVALAEGEALVLVTDGIAGPWRDGPETVAPGLGGAIASVPGALDLLRVADFSRQGCHDDRTIVAVWPRGGEPA